VRVEKWLELLAQTPLSSGATAVESSSPTFNPASPIRTPLSSGSTAATGTEIVDAWLFDFNVSPENDGTPT
jgi:hypothetical protein